MSGKDSNVSDLTVEILRDIRDEARKTNARLDGLNERVDGLNERVDSLQVGFVALRTEMHEGFVALRTEMHEGFEHLGGRIDNLLLGEHRSEHEELRGRVERIEQHLGLR